MVVARRTTGCAVDGIIRIVMHLVENENDHLRTTINNGME